MSVGKVLTRSSKSTSGSTLELKNELLKWICERHATNGPLDRKRLRDKAVELTSSLGILGFKCSESWLTVFLKKNGFCPSLTSCEGPKFADYRKWIDLMRPLISKYRHKDLFVMDELVMYSNYLPWGMREGTENAEKFFDRDDTIRIEPENKKIRTLLCCNSRGTEKLEPLVSSCTSDRNSGDEKFSISDQEFAFWLEKFNRRMSNFDRSVLLVLSRDRIRSLRIVQCLSNVKMLFLPRDFPTNLLPLRGDVFHCVKMIYRSRYVEFVRQRNNNSLNREWTSKEIVETMFEAWMDVPRELIVSNFQRTKFREDESFLKIHCPDWDRLQAGMSFRKFITFDDELSETRCTCDGRFSRSESRYNLRRYKIPTVVLNDDSEENYGDGSTFVDSACEERHDGRSSNGNKSSSSRRRGFEATSPPQREDPPIMKIDGNFGETGNVEENDEVKREFASTDFEEVNWRSEELNPGLTNFPGEADRSGRGSRESRGTPSRLRSPEFVHDEELRFRILNAIEMCAEPSRNDDQEDVDSNFKRAPSKENHEDEPAKKCARFEDWSKRYETNFAFGPESSVGVSESFPQNSADETSSHSKVIQTDDSGSTRKIFTLETSSELHSPPACPKTED